MERTDAWEQCKLGDLQEKTRKHIDIAKIKYLCKRKAIRWTKHAIQRLTERNICQEDVKYSLQNGEIIKQYPNASPYPKCLILGTSQNNNPLHIVCGISKDEICIITTYHPDTRWKKNFKTRLPKGKQ